jgi:MoaA/NifB/PqqE/SkfB family radical SAM enzyme
MNLLQLNEILSKKYSVNSINISRLNEILSKKYSVKSFTDLALLTDSPGAAHKFFYDLYQDTFDPTDMIVLYTSHPVPDSLLKHLYEATSFVNISNYFILLCTSDDISNATPGDNQVPFQSLKISLDATDQLKDNYFLPDTICAIPWMHLEIQSDGQFSPCCMSRDSTKIGNVQTMSCQDAFDSDAMKSLRQEFLDGGKPSICNVCWKNEERGVSSIRTHNIKRFKKQFLLEYLQTPAITSIDIKFNNTCNFKCRICGPNSSSLHATERHKFSGMPLNTQSKWSESDEFLQQIIEILPGLTFIDMYGGEPFLVKKFTKVLQIAVEQGYAKNIRLHYNSNGSIWPEEFIPYWQHFKEVDIHFSVDAIGKRFELQRGSTWEEVEANILKIKNLNSPNMTISVMPTISIMSVLYIDEVYDWANKHGFKLFCSNLVTPTSFNIVNLTASAKELVLEKFKNHPWEELQNILNSIRSSTPGDGKGFREKIKWFDSVRQENFVDSHSEIAQAMGYVYNN